MVGGTITEKRIPANTRVSTRFNVEFDPDESDESRVHCLKHDDSRISTFRGFEIDLSDECANADDSIRVNREPDLSDERENTDDSIRVNREFDSNEIDESDSQRSKHDDPRISIFIGISIHDNDDDEKLRIKP
jgi:hypothetical protein